MRNSGIRHLIYLFITFPSITFAFTRCPTTLHPNKVHPRSPIRLIKEQQQRHDQSPSLVLLQAVQEEDGKDQARFKKKRATPRSVAISALMNVKSNNDGQTFAVRKLESDASFLNIPDQRDRSFARLLVATVERRMGQIDNILGSLCASKYPPKKGKYAALIQSALRVGAAQLLFLETPGHAAVRETVEALRILNRNTPEAMIKFINAVLRNMSRQGPDTLLEQATSSASDNIATWLMEDWTESYGEQKTQQIAQQIMNQPNFDISTKFNLLPSSDDHENTRRTSEMEQLIAELGHDAKILPHGTIRISNDERLGDITSLPGFNDGDWWVQDASAAIPALALHAALQEDDTSSLHVVDMCAAPGGKTAQLLSAGFGKVTAIDYSARRVRRLVENLTRLKYVNENDETKERCQVITSRGEDWLPDEEDDVTGILLDVPCSATGTGSRRPDVLRRDSDLGNLLETQEMLANHCVDHILALGGVLVYATCSLLKRESEDQVHKLLARGEDEEEEEGGVANMSVLPFTPGEIPGFDDAIDKNGWLRVLPGALEGDLKSCDGFFAARLVKVG